MIISIDIETSGLDPQTHNILSIGAVNEVGDTFYEEITWQSPVISLKALEVNGFKEQNIVGPDTIKQVSDNFNKWLPDGKWIFMGWNPHFDGGFLKPHIKNLPYQYLDLHSLICFHHFLHRDIHEEDPHNWRYDDGSKYLGIELEPKPHNALNGAKHNWYMLDKLEEVFR